MRGPWLVAILLAGCEREAPSCEVLSRHAVDHIHARPFLSDLDRVRLRIKLPFRVTLTEEDGRHVERACADWSADYKLCIIDSRGSGFRCGREDIVWSALPSVKRWLEELSARAAEAALIAHERATIADLEVERLSSEAALVARQLDSGPRSFERVGFVLQESIERARDNQRKARALANECSAHPLEKVTCVALLP